MIKTITNTQSAAARAMLRLGLQDIEKLTGINPNSLSRFENGKGNMTDDNLEKLKRFFEDRGLEFLDHEGVRKSPVGTFRELSGVEGFTEFLNDVYSSVKSNPDKEVVVSNVNEKHFSRWFSVNKTDYLHRMADLYKETPFSFKILIEENDDYFLASDYAEYRWLDKTHFGSVPFYSYGDKTALLLFKDENVNIFVIDNKDISDSFRKSFYALWKLSRIPK